MRCDLSRRNFIKASSVIPFVGLLAGRNLLQSAVGQAPLDTKGYLMGQVSQVGHKFGLAVWSHKLRDFSSEDEVIKHTERLAEADVNILIPIVKFPSGAVDFLTSLADIHSEYPDWDPLKALIENSKKRGIKVHPWLCVFTEGQHSRLLREHPEFVAKGITGSTSWACAMRPEVQDYEFNLYKSVALHYNPDGLHLDYIRTGGPCRCEFCTAQMKKRGIDISKVNPPDPTWTEWRVSRLTEFVHRLRKFTEKEGMQLSAAVFRNYSSARIFQAQDWVKWAQQGLVDYLMPMNYTNNLTEFAELTKSHIELVGGQVPIWEGIGKKSSISELSTKALAQQAQAARKAGAQGVVIFNYHAITDRDFKALLMVRQQPAVEI
jgi:uncharacterized lipoprotein YddW (UPF0748 family)